MRAVLLGCLISVLPATARADEEPTGAPTPIVEPVPTNPEPTDPPKSDPEKYEGPIVKSSIRPREIVIDVPGLRTGQTRLVLGSLLAAGTLAGAVGLYFHLDSRSSANEISAQLFTGRTWTDSRQNVFDDTDRSRNHAIIAYTIGGLFVTGAIVAFIISEPKSERTVIRPHHAGLVPTPGGAMAGAGWSF